MNRVLKIALISTGVLFVLVATAGAVGYVVAGSTAERKLSRPMAAHEVDFPVPFPLTEDEIAALREERRAAQGTVVARDGGDVAGDSGDETAAADPLAEVDLDAIALERAIERGEHYVTARYACMDCHGEDFGGGVMIDDAAVGVLHGPNLTGGQGSRIAAFTVADWDRLVRHGIRLDGTPALMPSVDFFAMSDRELSDIIAFIRSLPPVDRQMEPVTLGPVLKIMIATGGLPFSADIHPGHQDEHLVEPPSESDTITFGGHLAQACSGCHNRQLTGGPVPGAPPDWAPASDLTRLNGWTFEEFETVLREGVRRDGSPVQTPMDRAVLATKNMTDEELSAVFAYLQSISTN